MFEYLPLLFALACPLGMLAMMAAPALESGRRAHRRLADRTRTRHDPHTACGGCWWTLAAVARATFRRRRQPGHARPPRPVPASTDPSSRSPAAAAGWLPPSPANPRSGLRPGTGSAPAERRCLDGQAERCQPPRAMTEVTPGSLRTLALLRRLGRLAGGEPFDDAELGALVPFDLESLGLDVEQGAAAQVLLPERQGDPLQQPLDRSHPPWRAGNVVQQQQPAAWAQHPPHLRHGSPVVGDAAQRQRADHDVERGVGQVEGLGVAQAQVDLAAESVGLAARQGDHLGAELDPGQADVVGVVGEVAAGADGDLQDLAAGLVADPLAAVGEQPAFPEGHLLVVVAGVVVPVAAQPLRPHGDATVATPVQLSYDSSNY